MYKSFRVKNFRCFKDLQINDLGRVNLIAGKNNVGKTALMEAIYIHSGNREPRTLLRVQPRTNYRASREILMRDSDSDTANILTWKTAFRNFDSSNQIEFNGLLESPQLPLIEESAKQHVRIRILSDESDEFLDVLHELGAEDYEVQRNAEILEISSDYSSISAFYLLLSGRVFSTKLRTKPLVTTEFLEAMKRTGSSSNAQRFSHLRRSNSTSLLVEALTVIEPRLEGLELLYDGYRTPIYANLGMSGLMPLTSLGEGMNRMTSLILAIIDDTVGVVFVDEIENGLHHNIHRAFWQAIGDLAEKHRVQVFATTHSLEMIRAAYEAFSEADELEEFRYHRLDRDKETGDIEAVTYNELDLDAVATFDFDYEVRG